MLILNSSVCKATFHLARIVILLQLLKKASLVTLYCYKSIPVFAALKHCNIDKSRKPDEIICSSKNYIKHKVTIRIKNLNT